MAWPDAFAGRALRGNLSARMQIAEPAIGCPTHAASAPASSCALRACVVVQPNVFLNERQNALWLSKPSASEISQIEVFVSRKIGRAHVGTPVNNAHIVCRLLLDKKQLIAL